MELTKATDQEIRDEIDRRTTETKYQQMVSAVHEIDMAFKSGMIEAFKSGNFEGNRSDETRWITMFFK